MQPASSPPMLRAAGLTMTYPNGVTALAGLTVDVPPGIVMDSYPGSYGQVLTNLFLNSVVHAFPEGRAGSVIVEARQVRDDVDIFVSDDGVGMTEEIQRRALDPFFTTRRNEGGTGLGLHIIFNLVTQQLGGRLTFESRLGWGTRFRITLPRVAPGESPPTQAAPIMDKAHG